VSLFATQEQYLDILFVAPFLKNLSLNCESEHAEEVVGAGVGPVPEVVVKVGAGVGTGVGPVPEVVIKVGAGDGTLVGEAVGAGVAETSPSHKSPLA
jgi:hypothetical protein